MVGYTISMFRFTCHDREYRSWELENIETGEVDLVPHLAPLDRHLFSGDTIGSDFQLIESPVRRNGPIAGVLVLSGSTYGRNSKNKTLYKCVPDNPQLPVFLVPYVAKEVGFSKKAIDRYVTFEYRDWSDKHPTGAVLQNVGPVNEEDSFYEYQLYRRGVYNERTRTSVRALNYQKVLRALQAKPVDVVIREMADKWGMEDRTAEDAITIDPKGCRDYDDALGVLREDETRRVSVYIANVAAWLEILKLWELADGGVSTVYLPHRTIPMLVNILSENLCSLMAGRTRPVLAMDLTIKDGAVMSVEFKLALIVVRNFIYEDPNLLGDKTYTDLVCAANCLKGEHPYIAGDLCDSHNLVSYYMIFMNNVVAEELYRNKVGLARNKLGNKTSIPSTSRTLELVRAIEGYQGGGARYVWSEESGGHSLIAGGLNHYTHITSPIRRAVDLANLVAIQESLNLVPFGDTARAYVEKMRTNIDNLNISMRQIARVHSDCQLLRYCIEDPQRLKDTYSGVIMEIIETRSRWRLPEEHTRKTYVVYIADIGLMTRVNIPVSREIELYSSYNFTIHMFRDATTLSKKIRLNCLD